MTTVTCAHRQKTFCIDTLLDMSCSYSLTHTVDLRNVFVSPSCTRVTHSTLNVSSCSNSFSSRSVQERRRREDPEEAKLTHDRRGRGQGPERNDIHTQPSLNDTSEHSARSEAKERKRDGSAQRQVLVAQQPHSTQHRERKLHARRIIHTRRL